jgi:hypothetical protein
MNILIFLIFIILCIYKKKEKYNKIYPHHPTSYPSNVNIDRRNKNKIEHIHTNHRYYYIRSVLDSINKRKEPYIINSNSLVKTSSFEIEKAIEIIMNYLTKMIKRSFRLIETRNIKCSDKYCIFDMAIIEQYKKEVLIITVHSKDNTIIFAKLSSIVTEDKYELLEGYNHKYSSPDGQTTFLDNYDLSHNLFDNIPDTNEIIPIENAKYLNYQYFQPKCSYNK